MRKNINKYDTKIMSATEAAYVAGFMDGEGTIGIVREQRSAALSGYRYSAYCNICNTCLAVLEAIQAMTGNGRIGLEAKPKDNHKDLWRIHYIPNQLRHILPQLMPYLIIKRRQAEAALELLEMKMSSSNYKNNNAEEQHRLWSEVRTLNTRGISKDSIVFQGIRAVHRPESTRCSIDGCDGTHCAKGFCRKHYKQMLYEKQHNSYGKQPCALCGKKIPDSKIFSAKYCSTKCKRRANYLTWRKRFRP